MLSKLQIVSDLHLEFGSTVTIDKHAPYLALLGDIGLPFQPHYTEFLKEQSEQFDHVFVILGNHEYYGSHTANKVVAKVQSICAFFSNVTLLDRDSYALSDKTILVGCTLWSHIDSLPHGFNDFNKIHVTGHERKQNLTVNVYNEWHQRDLQYMIRTLEENKDKDVIVLTHHAPSHEMQGKYRNSPYCSAFATSLDKMIQKPIVAWASGHIHSNVDTLINGVRSVSNCKGYKNEQTGYKKDVTIGFL
jgi:DNA repair exonuclease SbcCD nuclease subunit